MEGPLMSTQQPNRAAENAIQPHATAPAAEENEIIRAMKNLVAEVKASGVNPYPYSYKKDCRIEKVIEKHKDIDTGAVMQDAIYGLAGRIVSWREHGKSIFGHILDESGKIQFYIKKGEVPDDKFRLAGLIRVGDFLGVSGPVFKTKTGELSILAKDFELLSKIQRPLPEKFHGLTDVETRYRQRYLDLITSEESRGVFIKRSKTISYIRQYLNGRDFLEVETPVLQPIYGGASARPFETFHNTLQTKLYMRIAPELYLKRLIAGGFERVYELGRVFRNEGISIKHNPEFTMLELYMAYADYEDIMELTEDLISETNTYINKSDTVTYNGVEISFKKPWARLTMKESITKFAGIAADDLESADKLREIVKKMGREDVNSHTSHGELINILFEEKVEEHLIQPTFIKDYPIEISPLAKNKRGDEANLVERFELFIFGRETANAFSELNDPEEQRSRFKSQLDKRNRTDEDIKEMDEDYITALEYAMPPTGGLGIGIDRLIMLLTGSQSIRDVILFPLQRSKDKEKEKEAEAPKR
jgi:lysyl-tRNA synthetase class 2